MPVGTTSSSLRNGKAYRDESEVWTVKKVALQIALDVY